MKRLLAAPRRVLIIGALAAVAVVVAAGYGYAAVTATNQVYTGCLQGGSITNLAIGSAPTKSCPSNATQISWSQTGPQGLQGIQGLKGDKGDQGLQGIKGDPGLKGDQGLQGIQGLKGDPGTNGTNGTDGAKGDQGIQGIQGVKGDQGVPGPANLAALQGSPCTVSGRLTSLDVSVDNTGAVSMICGPLYQVIGRVVYSRLPPAVFTIRDSAPSMPDIVKVCEYSSECTLDVPKGHDISVEITDPRNFEYRCPGSAYVLAPWVDPVNGFRGSCVKSSLSGPFAVDVNTFR